MTAEQKHDIIVSACGVAAGLAIGGVVICLAMIINYLRGY